MRFINQALAAIVVVGALSAATAARQEAQVYRPGHGVTLPQVVSKVPAEYTPEAKAARIEGTVGLDVVVQADGAVGEVRVAQSLDAEFGLDRQAVAAMKRWRFTPGTKDKKPVAVRVQVEMTFSLK